MIELKNIAAIAFVILCWIAGVWLRSKIYGKNRWK